VHDCFPLVKALKVKFPALLCAFVFFKEFTWVPRVLGLLVSSHRIALGVLLWLLDNGGRSIDCSGWPLKSRAYLCSTGSNRFHCLLRSRVWLGGLGPLNCCAHWRLPSFAKRVVSNVLVPVLIWIWILKLIFLRTSHYVDSLRLSFSLLFKQSL
jgi:hypothetical protein